VDTQLGGACHCESELSLQTTQPSGGGPCFPKCSLHSQLEWCPRGLPTTAATSLPLCACHVAASGSQPEVAAEHTTGWSATDWLERLADPATFGEIIRAGCSGTVASGVGAVGNRDTWQPLAAACAQRKLCDLVALAPVIQGWLTSLSLKGR